MSEKLGVFSNLYKEKATTEVERYKGLVTKAEEKLNRAKTLWAQIKGEAERLGLSKQFSEAFPEAGGKVIVTDGVNPNTSYTVFFDYDDSIKVPVRELTKLTNATDKLKNAEHNLANAQSLLARKPEDHLKILGNALFQTAAEAQAKGASQVLDSILGKNSKYEDFEDLMMSLDQVDGPSGVNTSQPAYEALKEKFEAGEFSKKKEETGPINTAATKSSEKASSSAINPPEGEKKTEAEKSTVNPVAAPPTETAVEKTTGTVTGTPTALPKEAEVPKPSTAINISVETPAGPEKAPTGSVAGTMPQPTPTAEIGPKPLEKTTVTSEPIIIEPPTKPGAATTTGSPVNEESAKKKQEAANAALGVLVGVSPAGSTVKLGSTLNQLITEPSTTTNTTQVSNTTTQSTINQSTASTIEGAANTANQTVSNKATSESFLNQVTNSNTSALANRYFKSVFAPVEEKKKGEVSEKVETNPQTMSEATSNTTPENVTEVTKTSPSFPEKIQPSSEKIIEKANSKVLEKTQEMMNQKEMVKAEMVSSPEKSDTPVGASTGANESQQAAASPKTSINMDGLEARLSRLEYLLSNPLEVKIVE